MSIDWDIDSYKTEFETEEHWELKKRFMLAHKDKFPEDELVCLAQVFTNIEFMGCRYPEQTMKRVALLAKGVVEDFREKKKNTLKRTFVAASDAASAKVKGLTAKTLEVKPAPDPDEPKVKSRKIDQIKSDKSECKPSKKTVKWNFQQVGLHTVNAMIWSTLICQSYLQRIQNKSSVLDNFIVFYLENEEDPMSVITKSTSENHCRIKWSCENTRDKETKVTKLYINGEFIAEGEGKNIRQCKKNTAKAAVDRLKENCFGIKLNKDYRAVQVSNKDIGENSYPNGLGKNNIGARLMLLMGWKGGGLGIKEQGIKEPIALNMLAKREGFGSNSGSNNNSKAECELKTFKKRAENFIMNWLKSESRDDLMFSPEFTSDERKELHLIAHAFCLKSKSQGKKNNRRLLISRKQHPLEIVKDLIKAGGCTNKFQLIYPSNLSNSLPIIKQLLR